MRATTYAARDTRALTRWGVILAALTMLLALLPSGARAQSAPPPENVTTVNATGERFILDVDGQKFDVEPEEMSIQVGALQFCETCNLTFGEHTFEAALKRENEPNQVVATLTTSITADPDFDYSLVFHYGPNGGYALSVYRDDVRPMPETETRVEIRHVAQGGAVDYVLTSNGENQSVPNDQRTGTLSNPQWVREYQVTVNDYELQVYPAGAPQDAFNLAACSPDLELEGAASNIVYIGGRIVPAKDLDNTDVDQTKGFADTCRDLADKGGSYQRSSYTDGFDVRGYNGSALTMALSVQKDSNATVTSPTGPAAPYDTTVSTGGTDAAPTVNLTSPADGSTQEGTFRISADASDDDSVSEVTFSIDGTTVATDSTAPYEFDWDSTSVADGSHEITATATDSAGQTASSSVTVTVDNSSSGGSGGSGDITTSLPGVVRGNTWYLDRDLPSDGDADHVFGYGSSSWEVVTGDWDGDGIATQGVFTGRKWYLSDTVGSSQADHVVTFGSPGDVPVVGDWDGDGDDDIGVRRDQRWFFDLDLTGGSAELSTGYGSASDTPVVGDWDGDGKDGIGVVRGNRWFLDNGLGDGADIVTRYGSSSDIPVTGDWDGDGDDSIGVVRGNRWFLDNGLGDGADMTFRYGSPSDTPVVWGR